MTELRTTRPPRTPRPAVAAVGLVLAGAVALAAAAALALWVTDQVLSTRLWRVESVVASLVVAVGVLATSWVGASALVAGTCAAVRSAGGAWRAGEAAVQRWAPGLVRRALAVAVAAGVGLGAAAGAHAAVEAPPTPPGITVDLGWTPTADLAAVGEPTPAPTADPAAATPPGSAATTSVAPPAPDTASTSAPTPDAPATATPAAVPPAAVAPVTVAPVALTPVAAPVTTPDVPAAPAPVGGTVEVRPGDTLWGIAARALGADASDAAIAAEWPRWYAANAATIGPDPDVLRPGQVLVVPTADGGTR